MGEQETPFHTSEGVIDLIHGNENGPSVTPMLGPRMRIERDMAFTRRAKVVGVGVGVGVVLAGVWALSVRTGDRDRQSNPYDREFFAEASAGSASSAAEVVPEVIRLTSPLSVIDLGGGTGEWLAEFRKRGIADVVGVDGPWVERATLKIPQALFLAHDLRTTLSLNRTFDLAVSLETAEHLPPERADGFVADLTALAPMVLFSAAVPGQGGIDHLNEQWPEYWATRFREHSYVALDVLRMKFWENRKIKGWYRRNMILYVRRPLAEESPALRPLLLIQPEAVLPLVSPPN